MANPRPLIAALLRLPIALAVLAIAFVALPGHAIAGGSEHDVRSGAKPLKVFILAGQSNMQGHAHVRTLDAMSLSPDTASLLGKMRDAEGVSTVLDDVRISSIGSSPSERVGPLTTGFGANPEKIGPELCFGITMHEHLGEPILLIKTAWGGRSLHTDFRSPSGGPFVFSDEQLANFERQEKDVDEIRAEKVAATGRSYREMIAHVRAVLADVGRVHPAFDSTHGFELAGFVWFQGWNDMVDGGVYPRRGEPDGYAMYGDLLAHFIRDVRRDLGAPELPFVIGVMGVGGPLESYGPSEQRHKATHGNFRAAMAAPAAMPEFRGNVVAVETAPYWDMEVVALRERERELKPRTDAIRQRVKDGELSRADGDAALAAIDQATFSERELVLLRESVSNGDYHYMGSARILAPIGKAFADAMLDLVSARSADDAR